MPRKLFQKGQSGNPSGRPRVPRDVVEAAKARSLEMLDILVAVARDTSASPSARISAASTVLDRAHGRPTVAIETSHREAARMTDEELEAIIRGDQIEERAGLVADAGRADDEIVH